MASRKYKEIRNDLIVGNERYFEKHFLDLFKEIQNFLIKNDPVIKSIAYDVVMESLLKLRKDIIDDKIDDKIILNEVDLGNLFKFYSVKLAIERSDKVQDQSKLELYLEEFKIFDRALRDLAIVSPLKLYFDASEFTSLEIAESISYLSDLYRSVGGDALIIDDFCIRSHKIILEPQLIY